MLVGLIIGLILISKLMNLLVKWHYTLTFSIIFGLFISIIPSVLPNNFLLGLNFKSFFAIILMIIGFFVSYLLGKLNINDVNN